MYHFDIFSICFLVILMSAILNFADLATCAQNVQFRFRENKILIIVISGYQMHPEETAHHGVAYASKCKLQKCRRLVALCRFLRLKNIFSHSKSIQRSMILQCFDFKEKMDVPNSAMISGER